MKARSAKNKGKRLQKWVCEKIADIFEIEYDQSNDQCEIHSREMGLSGVDVVIRGELQKKFPFSIECKNTEKLRLYEAIEQARANSGEDDWLLIHKKNHSSPIVIMDWGSFEKIVRRNT